MASKRAITKKQLKTEASNWADWVEEMLNINILKKFTFSCQIRICQI